MKLYPLQPLIFIAAYIFVAISILINNTGTALTGLGVLAFFIIIYFATARRRKDQLPATLS
jgi:APA family basic amino acid/polyamine antiporter